jgi:hypothetical protein
MATGTIDQLLRAVSVRPPVNPGPVASGLALIGLGALYLATAIGQPTKKQEAVSA